LNFEGKSITTVLKFQNGATVMITGGNNIGRIGVLQSIEKHPGSFEIVHIRDARGHIFATRLSNVMVIGDGKEPAISLPKGEGLSYTLIEERDARTGNEAEEADDDDESDA